MPMPVITRTVHYAADNGESTIDNSFAVVNDYMMDVIDISTQTVDKTQDCADTGVVVSRSSSEGSITVHQRV